MRKSGPALLLLALAAVLTVWLARREPPGPTGSPDGRRATPSRPEAAATPDSPLGRRLDPPVDPPAEVADDPLPEIPAFELETEPRARDGVSVSGTVVVVDEAGREAPAASGTIHLTAWRGSTGHFRDEIFRDGAWSGVYPPHASLAFGHALVDDRPAVILEPRERVPVTAGLRIAVRVCLSPPTVIHVLDAERRSPLDEVLVVHAPKWPREDCLHPGEDAGSVVSRGTSSPIEIAPEAGAGLGEAFFVRSPGYAWGRLEVDRGRGGERTVLLRPGGGLVVSISGQKPDPATVLRLRRAGEKRGQPVLEVTAGDRTEIALDSIEAGAYRVTAEIGRWWKDPLVLGHGEARVVAGTRASLALEIAAAPAAPAVPLEGTLVVPEAWEVGTPFLALRLQGKAIGGQEDSHHIGGLDDLRRLEGSRDSWRFRLPSVQAGRWLATVPSTGYTTVLEVGPGGARDVRIEVPPPGRVVLTVIDGKTGEPADLDEVHWNYRRPPGQSGGSVASADRNRETGRFEFRAPLGGIEVSVWGGGWRHVRERHTVRAGVNDLTLTIRRSGGSILVRFREGEAAVPWNWDWQIEVEPVGGEGRVGTRGGRDDGHLIEVSEPGLYRIRFEDLGNFAAVPAREVRVEEGKTVEVAVPLVRVR